MKLFLLRIGSYLALIAIILFLWVKYSNERFNRIRNENNIEQIRLQDRIKNTTQLLNKEQYNLYLEAENKSLREFLKKEQIKSKNVTKSIETIIRTETDTAYIVYLDSLINSIKRNENKTIDYEYTNDCFYTKGKLVYENNDLKNIIEKQNYLDTIQIVNYLERREWRFLFFKTRFLGKKEPKSTAFSSCGGILKTKQIEKLKY